MRRRTLGVKKEPTIMIIPMIDIVFFLLVFFMVGTLYMNTEQQIPLNLPSASTSTAKSIEPITITLHKRLNKLLLSAPQKMCIITRLLNFWICSR